MHPFTNKISKNHLTNLATSKPASLRVRYKFSFVSLIPMMSSTSANLVLTSNKQLLFKKSYLLATWLYYLTLTEKTSKVKFIKINLLPTKLKLYTFQKAPMAHKTNSQEHFKFKFYFFNLVFNTTFAPSYKLDSVQTGLLFFFLSKPLFPVFETNLLFLKSYQLFFSFYDSKFYQYK